MIRGLRRCVPFSLPPRAIIEKKQSGILLGQMPSFLCSVGPYESELSTALRTTKKAHDDVMRFASFRDSVGIRQNHVFSSGIGYFTGRNNVV